MKRIRLLLAVFAAMVGLSVNAQTWTGSDPAEGKFFLYNVGTGKFINVGDKSAGWGTNAYLTAEYGLDFTFEANNGAYNLNSQISNGASNNYLTTALWCDGAATPWTFTKVDRTDINAYTISNGSSYIVANAAGTDIEFVALSGTERDQWQIIGSSDILANLQANTAAGVKRTVATFFISDPDFGRNDLRMTPNNFKWTFSSDGGETVIPGRGTGYLGSGSTDVNGNYPNYGCQFWNNTFDIHQELTNLPNGIYEFEIYGYGTKGTTYIYATTAGGTTSKVFKNQTGASNFHTALNNIDNYGGNVTGLVQVTDGNLTIGVKRETNSGGDWTVIDQARLYYYGDYTFADAYGADLKVLITEAQALVDAAPLSGLATDLAAAITTAQGVMNNGETEGDFATGKTNLQNAVDAYNAKLSLVSRYVNVRAAALSVIPELDVTTTDADAIAATTTDDINNAVATLRAAFLADLPNVTVAEGSYLDVTNVLVNNPSVSVNTEYWTAELNGSDKTNGSWAVVNYGETEFYNNNFKFYQTLALIPGTWEFGVTGFHRDGNHSTYFYAGEDKVLIPGVASTVVNSMDGAKTYFDNGNGKVALKFLIETAGDVEIGIDNKDTQTDKWTIFRDFTLKYYGAPDYSIYETQWSEAVDAADAALATYAEFDGFAATEKTALTTAKGNVPTPEGLKAGYVSKIQALTDATAAYIAVSQKYQSAKEAIAKANAIKEAHNFASAEAIATFADAIKAISDKYDDLTLTQEEAVAAGGNLGTIVTGWHAGNNSPAAAYLRDGFALGDFLPDPALHVNTWSTEGDTDGSNFSVPFYESWTPDANSLPESTLTGTITGLPTGLYSVSAWVRVRSKNGVTAADATGITMSVNGGEAVDVTEGDQVGETQFNIKEYTATGLVKQGSLTLNFNIASDANISWLSFKNVKYTKERDLTPEEAFVAATADDYAALNAAIETHTLGFEADEYAPYNNIEAAAALAAAKAIDQTAENSQEDVQAATAAITDATWTVNATEVNAVYDGSFEADYSGQSGNINPTGWQRVKGASADGYNVRYMNGSNAGLAATTSHKALFTKQSAYYGYATGYTMPLKANTMYKITFVYGGWGDCKKDGYVSMAAPDGSNVTLSSTDLPVDATNADADVNAWKSYEAFFTTGEAGDYVLGLRKKNNDTSGQSQYVYGDIVIVKATADDIKPQLLAEITTASAANVTANVGDAAFQIPASAATALTSAISTAQGVYDNDEATIDGVLQAVEDLQAAETAYSNVELNAPADGQLFAVVLTYGGWDYDNKAMTFIAGDRTDQGNYNIKYAAEVNTNLAQAFTFTKVEGNNYTLSQIDAEGNVRYVTDGKTGYNSGDGSGIRTTTDVEKAAAFKIIATSKDGVYNIWNNVKNQFIGSQDAGVYTVNSHIDFKLVETTKPEITINTTAAGYGTTMLPFAVAELPENVKVYTCDATNGDVLTLTPADAIEANKPYIIEGEWEAVLTGDAQGINLTTTEGLLTGVYAETAAPVGSFVLQNNGKVGFYRVAEGKQPTVGANRAYLKEEAGARAAYFFGEGVTNGINAIEALTEGNVGIFNAAGVQQPRLQKGLNIVKKADGTSFKVMVK